MPLVVGCLVLMGAIGCGSRADTNTLSARSTTAVATSRTFPLPFLVIPTPHTTGMYDAAEIKGPFHATLSSAGVACAWLGENSGPTIWPQGWQVRFHPTQLIDPSGKVVATEGDLLTAGGDAGGPEEPTDRPCIPAKTSPTVITYDITRS